MKNYVKKHWAYILLLVALFTSFAVPALGIPVSEPPGGGAGLWEVDGTETQLITADDIDMQTQKIINLVDPTANQDAATKKYTDDSIDADVATHAALTATHGVAEIAGIADITSAITTHEGAADPHTGYRLESATDYIDGTMLSQDFGAGSGRLVRFDGTPISGNLIYIADAGADSPFSGAIDDTPALHGGQGLDATHVPYDGDSNEDMFEGLNAYDGSAIWGQIILHNTSKTESCKIVSVDRANNVITVTADSPDDVSLWSNNDVITVLSPTCGATSYMCDLDLSDNIPSSAYAVLAWLFMFDKSSTYNADREIELHPYETLDSGKKRLCYLTQADQKMSMTVVLPVISQKLCFRIRGASDYYFLIKIHGYWEFADT